MAKLPPRFIKLTLKPEFHGDVIDIIDRIEPGKLAATVIQLLRLYPQLTGQTAQFAMSAPAAMAEPVSALRKEASPTEEIVMPAKPSQPVRSRVSLNTGFGVLDED